MKSPPLQQLRDNKEPATQAEDEMPSSDSVQRESQLGVAAPDVGMEPVAYVGDMTGMYLNGLGCSGPIKSEDKPLYSADQMAKVCRERDANAGYFEAYHELRVAVNAAYPQDPYLLAEEVPAKMQAELAQANERLAAEQAYSAKLREALNLWRTARDNSEECEFDDMAAYSVPMPLFCDAEEAMDSALDPPPRRHRPQVSQRQGCRTDCGVGRSPRRYRRGTQFNQGESGMTTDKELLELAAKAAGVSVCDWDCIGTPIYRNPYHGGTWHPLTDDGDTLRLAVQFNMKVEINYSDSFRYVTSAKCWSKEAEECVFASEEIEPDPYAATRRAIVRAVAEIGRNMK